MIEPPRIDFSLNSDLIRLTQLHDAYKLVSRATETATAEQLRVLVDNVMAEFNHLREQVLDKADRRLAKEQKAKTDE